ncbi:hypothetical protein PYW07_010065 [Mythimna separata]|uniref:Uncharacterized protein n=1 Tax=Mythimna separata TaxID=271217 RepID=A0AAD7YHZ0_MYTSE|nr:hypothetical protein PYW07_010065 [Mythimna separata]
MLNKIKIATWNTNGLSPNKGEHFTKNSQIYIKNYNIYTTNHPDGTAHGGTAVLIKSTIDHYELPSYTTEHIQATSIQIQDRNGQFSVSALSIHTGVPGCPPQEEDN